jgi:hypothetical protein
VDTWKLTPYTEAVKSVPRSLAAGTLVWAVVMLVAVPGWGQSEGDGDAGAPAVSAPGGDVAPAPSAGSEQPEDQDAPPPPSEQEDASAPSRGDPYAAEPYEVDRSEGEAGIPAELGGDGSAWAGESDDSAPDDSAPVDPYATDPYDEPAE